MYTIGIGALVDNPSFNTIRRLEMTIVESTNDFSGLSQPPHITVKRPFKVSPDLEVEVVRKLMVKTAKKHKKFKTILEQYDTFEDGVVIARVAPHPMLKDIHQDLLKELKDYCKPDKYEADNIIFHSTLSFAASDARAASTELQKKYPLPIQCNVVGLGLFVGIHDLEYWAIISKVPLG